MLVQQLADAREALGEIAVQPFQTRRQVGQVRPPPVRPAPRPRPPAPPRPEAGRRCRGPVRRVRRTRPAPAAAVSARSAARPADASRTVSACWRADAACWARDRARVACSSSRRCSSSSARVSSLPGRSASSSRRSLIRAVSAASSERVLSSARVAAVSASRAAWSAVTPARQAFGRLLQRGLGVVQGRPAAGRSWPVRSLGQSTGPGQQLRPGGAERLCGDRRRRPARSVDRRGVEVGPALLGGGRQPGALVLGLLQRGASGVAERRRPTVPARRPPRSGSRGRSAVRESRRGSRSEPAGCSGRSAARV